MVKKKVKDARKVLQGKRDRILGKAFERKVRDNLVESGWIVNRFSKIVDLEKDTLNDAKPKFFMGRVVSMATGFPDFLIYKPGENIVCGVESKMTGKLDAKEKKMCQWLLDNKVFHTIYIAKKVKSGRRNTIEYDVFGGKK